MNTVKYDDNDVIDLMMGDVQSVCDYVSDLVRTKHCSVEEAQAIVDDRKVAEGLYRFTRRELLAYSPYQRGGMPTQMPFCALVG